MMPGEQHSKAAAMTGSAAGTGVVQRGEATSSMMTRSYLPDAGPCGRPPAIRVRRGGACPGIRPSCPIPKKC
jgi:hypothetical protein